METRTDELEKELRTQNQQYREAIGEINKYEEEIQKLNLPEAVRVQIDRYVSAIEVIKDAFVRSLNEKLEHRDEVLGNLKEIRNLISGGERTQQQTALWEESRLLDEQIQDLIMQNARIAMNQEQYQKEFDELVEHHSRVKQEYEEQAIAAVQDVGRVAQIDYFISTLEELNAPVTEFNEQLWISMAELLLFFGKIFQNHLIKPLYLSII